MGDTFNPSYVTWVNDEASLDRMIEALMAAPEITFDTETTGLNEFHPRARLVMATFTIPPPSGKRDDEPLSWILPLYHPESPFQGNWRWVGVKVFRAIKDSNPYLIAHHGKFDIRYIYQMIGVDLSRFLKWDTMLSSHLLDENTNTKLKDRAVATFGIENWADFDLSEDEAALSVPIIDLGLYAVRDTYWCFRLAQVHRDDMNQPSALDPHPDTDLWDPDDIETAKLGRVAYWSSNPTARSLSEIEMRGFLLDKDWVHDRLKRNQEILDREQEFLIEGTGYLSADADLRSQRSGQSTYRELRAEDASFAPTSLWFREWTMRAVDAGDLKVAALTPRGSPQWSKSVLTRQMRTGSEVARSLLDYRAAVKENEFLNSWLSLVRPDGRIHTQYHVGSLVTGRLSSSNPNVQQINRYLRPAFIPSPGRVMVDWDFSQLELRVAAHIADSQPMRDAFLRGDDLHNLIASDVVSKPPSEITYEERKGGKAMNFGFVYNQSAYGFQYYALDTYDIMYTLEECEVRRNAFFTRWDGLAQWHERVIRQAEAYGQVVSPIGRVRRVPDIWSHNEKRAKHAKNAAINSSVQSLGSDLMQISCASVLGKLPGSRRVSGANLVATVHDSIVGDVPEDTWEEVTREVIRRMTEESVAILRKMDCDFSIPLVAEASIGSRWGLSDVGEVS